MFTTVQDAVSLGDMTAEAAFAKLWVFLNYNFKDNEDESYYTMENITEEMPVSWRGETSASESNLYHIRPIA